MQEFNFISPCTLEEVCRALSQGGGRLIAGGTDVIPQMLNGRFRADRIVDLSRLPGLNFIESRNGGVRIGALATYAELIASPLVQAEAAMLVQAAETVGSIQTRHRGTLGGNIANASPAGDTLPPLLALNAEVTLFNSEGPRSLPLADLLLGPGRTVIAGDEIIHHVRFNRLPPGSKSVFLKLGNRQGMAVSVASAAIVLRNGEGGQVEEARIALGAVAPTAIRCPDAEQVLSGHPLTEELIREAAESASRFCAPIDDLRGTADYRRHAVKVLVQRGLRIAAGERLASTNR